MNWFLYDRDLRHARVNTLWQRAQSEKMNLFFFCFFLALLLQYGLA